MEDSLIQPILQNEIHHPLLPLEIIVQRGWIIEQNPYLIAHNNIHVFYAHTPLDCNIESTQCHKESDVGSHSTAEGQG